MMNASFWNKKAAESLSLDKIVKLERNAKRWFAYQADNDCLILDASVYELQSVYTY